MGSGSKEAGPHTFSLIRCGLERTGQAYETRPGVVSGGVGVVVVDGRRSLQALCELVFAEEASAPCVEAALAFPVVERGGDRQLFSCLEAVSTTNGPFDLADRRSGRNVEVCAGGVACVEFERARTDFCSDLADDETFFSVEVVCTPDGSEATPSGRGKALNANVCPAANALVSSTPRPAVKASDE